MGDSFTHDPSLTSEAVRMYDKRSLLVYTIRLLRLVSPALPHPSRLPRLLQHHGEGEEVEESSCGLIPSSESEISKDACITLTFCE